MSISEYLDSPPLHDLVKFRGGAANSVAFVGTLRKHPYDQEKCLLFSPDSSPDSGAGGGGATHETAIFEFRIPDVLGAEELSSTVDDSGTAMSRARLWIRRGAIAARYVPFEVGLAAEPAQGENRGTQSETLKNRIHGSFGQRGNAGSS